MKAKQAILILTAMSFVSVMAPDSAKQPSDVDGSNPSMLRSVKKRQNAISISADGREYSIGTTTKNSISKFGSIKANEKNEYIESDGRVHIEYTPTSIYKCHGVYTNYLPRFYSEAELRSGSYKYREVEENEYKEYLGESVSSTFKFGIDLVAGISAAAGNESIIAEGSEELTIGYNYSHSKYYGYSYSYSEMETTERYLGQNDTEYCPAGYGMSMGLVGDWVVLSGTFITYWYGIFGNRHVGDQGSMVLTFQNQSMLTEDFIYSNPNDSSWTGYLAPKTQSGTGTTPLPTC